MKITDIKQQDKRKDRYSVYVDGEFVFGLSENDLLTLGLKLGQEVSEADLKKWQQISDYGKVYDRVLNYLSLRPRSEYEIKTYLKRKNTDPKTVTKIIKRLKTANLLDDKSFAMAWVQWRQATTPRSRRKLVLELRQKGIENEIIEEALSATTAEDQLAILKQIIEKKRHRYDSEQKLMAYLARQGFDYADIKEALKQTE